MRNRILAVAIGTICLSSLTAFADTGSGEIRKPGPGVYFGGGIGEGKLKLTLDDVPGAEKTDDLSFKLFGGWRFNDYLSLEGSYVSLGQQKDRADGISMRIEPRWFSATAIGTWPLKENFAVYARAGVARWDADLRLSDGDTVAKASDHGTEVTYGVGLSSYLDGAIVRLEYERLDDATTSLLVENDLHGDLSLLSLSVAWKF